EFGIFGAKGEVAGKQRAIRATEAPAVHHRDGDLLVPAQPFPPGIRFALRMAHALQPLRLGLPEILLEVHPRRPGGARAGEHQHPTSSRNSRSLRTRSIWRLSFGLMELRFSGRLNFTQAMASRTSTAT